MQAAGHACPEQALLIEAGLMQRSWCLGRQDRLGMRQPSAAHFWAGQTAPAEPKLIVGVLSY